MHNSAIITSTSGLQSALTVISIPRASPSGDDVDLCGACLQHRLPSKAIKGTALPLQSIYNIESSHSLAACMLGVGDCIPDYILKEHLYASGVVFSEVKLSCCQFHKIHLLQV